LCCRSDKALDAKHDLEGEIGGEKMKDDPGPLPAGEVVVEQGLFRREEGEKHGAEQLVIPWPYLTGAIVGIGVAEGFHEAVLIDRIEQERPLIGTGSMGKRRTVNEPDEREQEDGEAEVTPDWSSSGGRPGREERGLEHITVDHG
jgi:hypothetical protein